MEYKVIYLTGAPVAGKSTLCNKLKSLHNIEIFEYGAYMSKHLQSKPERRTITQNDLKKGIDGFVTPQDIDVVDKQMLEFVNNHRQKSHVIIDSHHLTKEKNGFIASVFSPQKLIALNLTEIWVLYITAKGTRSRIKKKSGGRPLVSLFEADMHTFLQAGLALNYATQIGCQVFLFDSDIDPPELLNFAINRLNTV